MKNLLLIGGLVIGLLVGISQSASAQSVPNNGNPYPGWVTSGQVPPLVALWVIRQAQPTYQQTFGLGLLQLVHKYNIGQLTITVVTTNPPTNVIFRVSYGGIDITIIGDFF